MTDPSAVIDVSVNIAVSTTTKLTQNDHSNSKKTCGKRKSASLPSETVEYLKAWMMSAEHIAHPYPTEQEKVEIMKDTGIELKQLTNWFVNNRKRYWKPRVEARLQQQAQAAQAAVQAHAAAVAAVSAGSSSVEPQSIAIQQASSQRNGMPGAAQATKANLVSPKTEFKSTLMFANQHPPYASPLSFAAQILTRKKFCFIILSVNC